MNESEQAMSDKSVLTVPYHGAATHEIVATEAALNSLRKTRPWALLFAICLFVYAGPGLVMGTIWLVFAILKRAQTGLFMQFVVVSSINLMLAPLALIGGILVIRYHRAASRAYSRRNSEDLELALARQLHVWRWLLVTAIVVFAIPVVIGILAKITGAWS